MVLSLARVALNHGSAWTDIRLHYSFGSSLKWSSGLFLVAIQVSFHLSD